MAVKQMVTSASLAIGLAGSAALAEPVDSPVRSDLEAVSSDEQPEERDPVRASFLVGAGFGPDDGLVLGSAVVSRDLFGRGHALGMSAEISRRRRLFLLHAEPNIGRALQLSIDLHNREESWPGFMRAAAGVSLTLSRPIAPHTRAFVAYRLEDVSIERPDLGVALAPAGAEMRLSAGLVSALRVGVEYSSVDAGPFPRRGSGAGAWIEAADARIGSETDLLRARAWLGHHRPLGPLLLHLTGSADVVTSRDPLGVPLSERLQLDGSSELRGYAPGALGPIDAAGASLGGHLRMLGRAELEFPIAPRIGLSGTVFADAGMIADLEAGSSAAGTSVGFGLLWRSPLAALRLDLAFPLRDGKAQPALLLGMGTAF
jgi:outer membrane protein assembly factor BamA